jgi:aminopeptidase N
MGDRARRGTGACRHPAARTRAQRRAVRASLLRSLRSSLLPGLLWMIAGVNGAASSALSAAPPPFTPSGDRDEGKLEAAQRAGADRWFPGSGSDADTSGFDALHVDLTLEPLFDSTAVAGQAIWTLRVASPPPSQIVLDLNDNYTIAAAQIEATPVAYTQVENQLRLRPADALTPGATVRVFVAYRGHPEHGFLQGLAFTHHAGAPIVFTNSEPIAARTWWPCKDRPDDKFTADLRFIVPDTMTAASNGVLVESAPIGGGRRVFHWRVESPITTYLVSLVATNFATFTDSYTTLGGRTVPIVHYAYPEDLAPAQERWEITPRAMRCFAERFGEYPFAGEKYGMAEYPWSGAMEHQTLTSMGAYFLRLPRRSDWVVVHELAHQWWGDWVTCGTWRDIWLNEGFATYCEALWAESLGGPDSLRAAMLTKKDRFYPGSCYAPDFIFNSTVYRKGAWVLHMLRRVIGDAAFFGALRAYGTGHAYCTAVTADLQAACERAWGGDLTWFFDEWVYGEGRPCYGVFWTPGAQQPSGRTLSEVRIVQEASAPAMFRMPLDARLQLADGSEYATVLWDSLPEQTFVIETPAAPLSIRIDPDDWVLCEIVYGARPSAVAEDGAGTDTHASVRLGPALPNPGAAAVRIPLRLSAPLAGDAVEVVICDVAGRIVRRLSVPLAPGGTVGSVVWDGADASGRCVAGGVYFARVPGEAAGVASNASRIVRLR